MIRITYILFLLCVTTVSKAQIDTLEKSQLFFWKQNYAAHKSAMIDTLKQKEWINNKTQYMIDSLGFIEMEDLMPNIFDIPDGQKISYKIFGKGRIRFVNNETILIYTHSSHENPEVGDISIAFTDDNNIFVNYGHICGGIIHFEHYSLILPENPEMFFQNFVSDTDDFKWTKW